MLKDMFKKTYTVIDSHRAARKAASEEPSIPSAPSAAAISGSMRTGGSRC